MLGQISGGDAFRASDCVKVLSPGAAPIGPRRSTRSVRTNGAGKIVSLKAYWDYEKTMAGRF